MSPTVAIVAPGSMGAGVASCLNAKGATVLTSLGGRSPASRQRAAAAGMRDAGDNALAEADFLLSIVPPAEAVALAQRLAPALAAGSRRTIFVDCNAVSPTTAQAVADIIATTGCRFVDAGIIGPPPRPGSTATKFYASGDRASAFSALNEFGLIVRVLDGPLTAASALKMSYAGITKGLTALGAAMVLASERGGSAQALKAELAESQPELLRFFERMVPPMYGKAYRWGPELDEIANFVGTEHPESAMFNAAARLYEEIAADVAGDNRKTAILDSFLKQ
ncbi:NAD(P)-dependent oxidoreductase [Undibacter mobilis]|uniref:NAD(P)-dependent oxidoreductase n=1 Tax=Undibacter mobilis TaxID=2292256 RepID=A0A371B890_9BRAD|nr:NAD(P)-dependent oxidoreductase [Undibacter mobilis]RDV03737.1 NAD(P)-dependent oxidoreductase [Undibacter mobilis]